MKKFGEILGASRATRHTDVSGKVGDRCHIAGVKRPLNQGRRQERFASAGGEKQVNRGFAKKNRVPQSGGSAERYKLSESRAVVTVSGDFADVGPPCLPSHSSIVLNGQSRVVDWLGICAVLS